GGRGMALAGAVPVGMTMVGVTVVGRIVVGPETAPVITGMAPVMVAGMVAAVMAPVMVAAVMAMATGMVRVAGGRKENANVLVNDRFTATVIAPFGHLPDFGRSDDCYTR
ncbi:MAG: hypothetical protein WCD42_03535, partial [Rhizomicrobium sp.]